MTDQWLTDEGIEIYFTKEVVKIVGHYEGGAERNTNKPGLEGSKWRTPGSKKPHEIWLPSVADPAVSWIVLRTDAERFSVKCYILLVAPNRTIFWQSGGASSTPFSHHGYATDGWDCPCRII